MKLRTERTVYALDLPLEDFKVLNASDSMKWDGPTLEEKDLPEGVFDLEFNAHFGTSVYFSMYPDDDNEQTHAAMRVLIRRKLRAMRQYMEAAHESA